MITSRRGFLRAGALALVSAGIALKGYGPTLAQEGKVGQAEPKVGRAEAKVGRVKPPRVPLQDVEYNTNYNLTMPAFSQNLNTMFRVPEAMLNLLLIRVTDNSVSCEKSPATCGRESFSLLFRASTRTRPIKQRTYLFEHDQMGSFKMFIVPVGRVGKMVYYEAVFNRIVI
jgi:hypothetical protein